MSTIGREAAIDKFKSWLKFGGYSEGERNMLKAVLLELQEFPSAQPERKRGKWIIDRHGNWACDQCGNDPYHCNMENMNFCPNCGADMRGEEV